MASGSERDSTFVEDDELKGDGKKRKFKPLEAVRKFFGKSKRKSKDEQVNVVAVKARSTTALHHGDDEDDDDGGFKNRQPRPLGGTRSISEDSVFSPEQRESTNLQALKKTAVSEESLPKSALQAELQIKLNKRRSQYSDEDDGLPHSPTPPVTTADIIMGGPLKPLPAGGKSTSRESDKSLISVDGSENDEDDPFASQWKSSVPSKVSKQSGKSEGGSEGSIDFDKVAQTELLKSDLAKDRISVKPRTRKATRQSRKKRDGQSPHSLPSLNEESPTKSPTDSRPRQSSFTDYPKDEDKVVEMRPRVLSVDADYKRHSKTPVSEVEAAPATPEPKLVPKATTPSKHVEPAKLETHSTTTSSSKDSNVIKVSFDTKKSESAADSSPRNVPSKMPELTRKEKDSEPSMVMSSPASSPSSSVMSKSYTSAASAPKSDAAKERSQTGKARSDFSSHSFKSSPAGQSPDSEFVASARIVINSSGISSAPSPVGPSPSSVAASSAETTRKDGLRPTDEKTPAAFSPKDDYKLRRQNRSKTLPEQPFGKEEQSATKVQRAESHRVEAASSQTASPETSPMHRKKVVEAPKSKEPEWFALARRKTGRQGSDEKSESPSPTKETAEVTKSPSEVTKAPVSSSASASETVVASSSSAGVVGSVSSVPKTEAVAKPSPALSQAQAHAPSAGSVSSASSKFEPKLSEVSRVRGGSVKTSPTKTNAFSSRGGSVKVASVRTETGADRFGSPSSTAGVTPSSLKTSSTPVSAPHQEKPEEKESGKVEVKPSVAESSPTREVPKWKTQSVKSTPTYSSSHSASPATPSHFSSVKPAPHSTTPTSTLSSSAKTEPKVAASLSSPAKRSQAPATAAVEDKEKGSGVPAWRANLNRKKSLDPDIKIELIESNAKAPSSTAGGTAGPKKDEVVRRQESPTKVAAANKDLQSDQCRSSASSNRNSKVMNLLKNFENIQGVS